jgi:hypothetical protein
MPIARNMAETADLQVEGKGPKYVIGPITSLVESRASDHIHNDRWIEGMHVVVSGGGLRGLREHDGTLVKATPEMVESLTLAERTAIGAQVYRRWVLQLSDSD